MQSIVVFETVFVCMDSEFISFSAMKFCSKLLWDI